MPVEEETPSTEVGDQKIKRKEDAGKSVLA